MTPDAMVSLRSPEAEKARSKKNESGEPMKTQLLRRLVSMRSERAPYEDSWLDCGDYLLPERPRGFLRAPADRELADRSLILDGSAFQSVENAKAGLLQGMASPERPWFRFDVDSPELSKQPDVRSWLEVFRDSTLAVYDKSNFYTTLAELFRDELVFGTAAIGIFHDVDKIIRCETYPIGSFYLDQDASGRVDSFAREFSLPVRRVAELYGKENLSESAQRLLDKSPGAPITLAHMIVRNDDGDVEAFFAQNLPWSDFVFEIESKESGTTPDTPQYAGGRISAPGDGDKYLSLGGYHEFPIQGIRWSRNGEDIYASSWPGRVAIGDIMSLQEMERDSLNGLKKMVDPALVGGPGVKGSPISLVSGDLSIDPTPSQDSRVRPIHDVRFPVDHVEAKAEKMRDRISRAFYEHIFLMLLGDGRAQPKTAMEIQERIQEKLSILGPTMERHSDDLFDSAISRTTGLMIRRSKAAWARGEDGVAPRPPESVLGVEWRPQYISEIAQAQKLVGVNSLERHAQFAGVVMGLDPEAVDVFDGDAALRRHAASLGLPANTSRTDDSLMDRREQRNAEMEAQRQQEQMPAMAGAAKNLSETPVDGDTALSRILGA